MTEAPGGKNCSTLRRLQVETVDRAATEAVICCGRGFCNPPLTGLSLRRRLSRGRCAERRWDGRCLCRRASVDGQASRAEGDAPRARAGRRQPRDTRFGVDACGHDFDDMLARNSASDTRLLFEARSEGAPRGRRSRQMAHATVCSVHQRHPFDSRGALSCRGRGSRGGHRSPRLEARECVRRAEQALGLALHDQGARLWHRQTRGRSPLNQDCCGGYSTVDGAGANRSLERRVSVERCLGHWSHRVLALHRPTGRAAISSQSRCRFSCGRSSSIRSCPHRNVHKRWVSRTRCLQVSILGLQVRSTAIPARASQTLGLPSPRSSPFFRQRIPPWPRVRPLRRSSTPPQRIRLMAQR